MHFLNYMRAMHGLNAYTDGAEFSCFTVPAQEQLSYLVGRARGSVNFPF